MLEIGALTPCNYASCSSWIRNTPIDLNALHPDILEQDFFDRPLPRSDDERFDVISCSLVLNFIADPHDRGKCQRMTSGYLTGVPGRMLFLMHEHLRPTESSLLFLVLPSSCIANSRYISSDSLRKLMAAIGFEFVQESWKVGGKLGYWLWRWRPIIATQDMARWEKKVVQTEGSKRNNFSIVLPKGFLRSR